MSPRTPTRRSPSLALAAAVGAGVFGGAGCSGDGEPVGRTCSPIELPLAEPAACAGGDVVHGVDVSVYQGDVDWADAKAHGIGFAFARVSDGTGFPDTRFATNWPAMKAAGVVRGAYQFFRPGEDPAAQAGLFVSMLAGAGGLGPGDLPPVLDVEVTDGVADAALRAAVQAWLDAIQRATAYRPILYLSPAFAVHLGAAFGGYAVWVANWGVSCPALPAGWSAWEFWQTSDMGTVPGIAGAVDLDEFNGPLGRLQQLGQPVTSEAGVPSSPVADAGASHADAGEADAGGGADAAAAPGAGLGMGMGMGGAGAGPGGGGPGAPCSSR